MHWYNVYIYLLNFFISEVKFTSYSNKSFAKLQNNIFKQKTANKYVNIV